MLSSSSNRDHAVARLQEQISVAKAKLNLIDISDVDYTGNRFDDTLMAVSADSKRDYWESRLLELESLLAQYSAPHEQNTPSAKQISVGDLVKLQKPGGAVTKFRLVHRLDFSLGERCMTASSPLGQAVLGKQPGDVITISTPSGKSQYTIIEMERGF